MDNPFEKVAAARRKYEETVEALSEDLKKYLRAFMQAHPELEYVSWKQYTDYFNDGDACNFYVRGLNFKRVDTDEEDFDEESLDEYWGDNDDPLITALEELYADIEGDSDLMLALFGDHAEVTLTSEEVSVTSYTHHD